MAGVFHPDGRSVAGPELERMVESLAHRGPDGSGAWCHGPVGLVHRMLWTTPESLHEVLPLVCGGGELAITADARLDNREELIRVLEIRRPAAEVTDSELILAAYDRWGAACPQHLLGDFAFAIWDGKRHRLFCARDPFGVRPFYYYAGGTLFAFASEIKALLCLPSVPRKLNEARVADFLTSQFEDRTITFYEGILRLPPGHSASITREEVRLASYYALDPSRELRLESSEAYAEGFREIFTEAVRCRMRSAFPVGSLLSGGLDSSSVTCVARRIRAGSGHLPTFSAVFNESAECDERSFIETVLAQSGLDPHYVNGDSLSPLVDLDRLLWHLDEALYSFNLCLDWGLCASAKKQGVRVLLDGFDGDTTVSHGHGYLRELALGGEWLRLAGEARGVAKHRGQSTWAWMWPLVWHYALNPASSRYAPVRLVGRVSRRIARALGTAAPHSIPLPTGTPPLTEEFCRRINLGERLNALWSQRPSAPRTEREDHYRTLTSGVMPFTLEVLDRGAAAFGIEQRYPFWDRRLVEFCLALPGAQKLNRGWSRVVMRRAMEGILPAEVQWRGGKSNLTATFVHGLLTFEQERVDELIQRNPGVLHQYLNMDVLRQAHRRVLEQRHRAAENDVVMVWKALTLGLWFRHTGLTG